jgi:voltage-dependent anion channel protein 2
LRHRPPGTKQNPQPKPPPAFLSSVTLSKRASKDFLISYQYTPSSQLDRVTLIYFPLRKTGLTLTQTWTTANSLDTKVELDNSFTKGLKAEVLTNYLPTTQAKGAKLNLFFKQPNFHARAFFDLLKGPTANVDAVLGHEGFLVGAEAGYDVQKAAITRYSAAIGYSAPEYTAAITATNSLSIFSASYYQRVNSQTEVGAKATWDSKAGSNVGLELASKYILDPSSFAKVSNSRLLVM